MSGLPAGGQSGGQHDRAAGAPSATAAPAGTGTDAAPGRAHRPGPGPGLRGAVAVLAVFAGLALALLASHSGPPFSTPPEPPSTVQTARPAPTSTGLEFDRDQDRPPPRTLSNLAWLYVLVAAGMLFLGACAIPLALPGRPRRWWPALGWRRPAALQPRPQRLPRTEQVLATAVAAALVRLEEGPAGDAIVACWVRLEQAAAQAGTPRQPAETSAELTERVLADHQVTAQTLRRLAALYREARFSRHRLGDSVRGEARELFERVRDELQGTR